MSPRKNTFIAVVLTSCSLLTASQTVADNRSPATIGAQAGYYRMKATTATNDLTIAEFGIFNIEYKAPFTDYSMLSAGYSMYTQGTAVQDLGYGLDVGGDFYPAGLLNKKIADEKFLTWTARRPWAYFLGARFSQRQYQSIQASYAGLCGLAGFELSLTNELKVQLLVRALTLKGPQGAKIAETNALLGLFRDL